MLDRSRPYGEVHGLPSVFYEQDGKYFRMDGAEVKNIDTIEEDIIVAQEEVISPIACIEQPSLPIEAENGRNLEDMHWRHLKALIESFGGEWTNRKEALEFMKGK